ncbi:hypothetical protein Rahaq_1617 [Rahnella aceris]|jgi:hypothetical protein|uniref:Uncharacterized protein n=1 Tax=Rahnella sp. (strain Y9602) TaxID=2703885 RepID=A0A0H3F8L6_RAHSY|nr:hypothetical protein Rahaq_1617 [Rahnella aceris]AFE57807.1 hypothetical protein Q7S_07825 [Rahnella aquatilis HX2]MDP9704280.1 hypothetical protein [Rahnella aquatilis]RKT81175.1 hypothetical protein BJ925_1437 [Rahnella aquatilis]
MKGDIATLVSIILFYIFSYYCVFLTLSPPQFGGHFRHILDVLLN